MASAIKRETLLDLGEGITRPEEKDNIYKAVLQPSGLLDIAGLDMVLAIEKYDAKDRMGNPHHHQPSLA